MRTYKNIIFDLYGTLIDIYTNEYNPSFWDKMAEIYEVYGASYSGQEMREAYLRLVREEEEKLARNTGTCRPEIQLENVFRRLFLEKTQVEKTRVEKTRACGAPAAAGIELPDQMDTERGSAWIHMIANVFRVLSREKFCLFPGTLEALKTVQGMGCRLFMLSNAQAVFTRPEIEVCGLTPFFEGLYLSSDLGLRKPAQEFMEKLLTGYGLDPRETVMIGNDVYSDMKIADLCGITGILLNTARAPLEEIHAQIQDCEIQKPERIHIIQSGDLREVPALLLSGALEYNG